MAENNALAMTSLTLHIVTLGILSKKGFILKAEIKEAIDTAILLLEENGLIFGDEGRAVHANLEMVFAIVSSGGPLQAF